MDEELLKRGLQIRKNVVGEKYVQQAFERAGDFGADFQNFLTEYCWGASWGREALTLRDRSLLNIVLLGALGRSSEFRTHLKGALRNGVSKAEINDALIHLSVYAGVPAGVEAYRIAVEVFEEQIET